MKVLIISRTPWNLDNSFGNTFTNLFDNIGKMEIYHICCQSGKTKGSLAKKTFQITEHQILKNKKNMGEVINTSIEETKSFESSLKKINNFKRMTILYIIRDLIWKFGKVETSQKLLNFLRQVNPDIIYLPIYNSWYMCDIQSYICDQYKSIPVVGHISDDVYNYSKNLLLSPIETFYKFVLKKKLKKVIKKCCYLEVFAKNMKMEYEKQFDKKCFLIGKGIDLDIINETNFRKIIEFSQPIKFVYTGNLGNNRWKIVYELGKSLERLSYKKEAILEVYSGTQLSDKVKKLFKECKNIKFMGAVSSKVIKEIQNNSDILVHVEGFDKESISSTRMSFSTKIMDYLCTGNLVLAIGPSIVNSIEVIKENNLGIVEDNIKNIDNTVSKILLNQVDKKKIKDDVYNYLKNQRDIRVIQKEIYERMLKLVKNRS